MAKKFTEKQYQKIVDAWNSEMRYVAATKSVSDYLVSNDIKFMGDEALAIANPLTREWAHRQYVEKENKYVRHLKTDSRMIVSKTADDYWYLDRFPALNKEFTRIEIENSPFDPDWFDKAEE